MFKYYEDGQVKQFSFKKVYRMFITLVDENQKSQGTTFTSWLDEMEHMQILVRYQIIKQLFEGEKEGKK